MVVDLFGRPRAEDPERALDDEVAAGVRVFPGELHRLDVRLSELAVGVEKDGRRVHRPFLGAILEAQALREREEARRGLVAEAARAEVDADPEEAVLVNEQVDVVVAAADRAELVARELRQLALRRELSVLDHVENRVVDAPAARASDAERDLARDLVHHNRHVDVGGPQRRACRLVAAPDVEPDSARGDVMLIRGGAADRHRVTDVVVRAQHAVVRFDEAALELLERARLGLSEDLDLRHQTKTSALQPAIKPSNTSSTPRSEGWTRSTSTSSHSSRPSAPAPSSAPKQSNASVEITLRRPLWRRAIPSSSRSSSSGSMRTFESEPMQMPMLRLHTRSTGRKPSPRFDSVVGHAQTRAPACAIRSSSAPSACVACTTVVRSLRQPLRSSSSIGRTPCSARHSSISRGCSSAWTCSGSFSSAA